MNKKNIFVTALVALAVSFVFSISTQQSNVGGLSERDIKAVSLQVGQDGTNVGSKFTFIDSGTCTLLANFSIAATSTKSVDCVISGVRSGDIVRLTLAGSSTLASQYVIKSSNASTTNGYATAWLINLTGAAAIPSATNGFGSSTQYQIWRASN